RQFAQRAARSTILADDHERESGLCARRLARYGNPVAVGREHARPLAASGRQARAARVVMEPARAPEESAARDSSEHQRSREHERLLELARRLRAVVEELRHYAGESAQHAEAAAQAPLALSDALMLDG